MAYDDMFGHAGDRIERDRYAMGLRKRVMQRRILKTGEDSDMFGNAGNSVVQTRALLEKKAVMPMRGEARDLAGRRLRRLGNRLRGIFRR